MPKLMILADDRSAYEPFVYGVPMLNKPSTIHRHEMCMIMLSALQSLRIVSNRATNIKVYIVPFHHIWRDVLAPTVSQCDVLSFSMDDLTAPPRITMTRMCVEL